MSESVKIPRSPELMSRHDTALLVVDVQEKLISLIPNHKRLIWNIRRLLDAASILKVRSGGTEQYPQGLGPTTQLLADRLPDLPAKTTFSCRECADMIGEFREAGINKILVVGIEAHVCIQQTVLDLLSEGFRVYVAADAVGSRHDVDREIALRRLDSSGAILTTTESAIFEWCDAAGTPEFKEISKLVREPAPEK